MAMRWILIGLAAWAAFAAAGCAGFEELVGKDYPDSAELNYNEGLKFLDDENYEVAEKYFSLVKTKYSYSLYAKMAELLLADTQLRQDLFADAINSYKTFQQNHPTHACVAYAQYRIGESYFEQIAEDWWFMPPAHERDQDLTEKALSEFRRLLAMEQADGYWFEPDFKPIEIEHCEGRNHAQLRSMVFTAKEKIRLCVRRLVDREVYAASFYLKNDKPAGAVGRLEGVFERYPELAEDLELVSLLARAYTEAHMFKRARATWNWAAAAQPESALARDVPDKLADLDEAEADWKADQAEEAEDNRELREREAKIREEQGLLPVDPDPDPDADAVIPLPPPKPKVQPAPSAGAAP
ncbi:MAG: outer membrane protein assembly factor BamD [Myxococcales bacterium]|nr:MAG: outer membrane protein assembly factor BamD [Myxococcales bacterium]